MVLVAVNRRNKNNDGTTAKTLINYSLINYCISNKNSIFKFI